MAKVLVIAEHDGNALNPSTAKVVACAASLGSPEIDILVLGSGISSVATEAAAIDSVARVLTVDREENLNPVTAILAPQIVALAGAYSHVFGPSTTFGRDLMPRVAALMGVNQISDIVYAQQPCHLID